MNTILLKGGQPGAPGLAPRRITDKHGRQVTHWVRAHSQVEQRARRYTEAQQELSFDADPYAQLPTRPDTTPAQRQAGRDALVALRRRVGQLRATGGPTATLLGARLAADFQAGGHAQLVGQPTREPADLALLAQVYRDPRFETFRALYLRGDRVVGEAAYSSCLPGAVRFPPTLVEHLWNDHVRFGADGYYLLHNHPSGTAKPSTADLAATAHLAFHVPGLKAHVVVDHQEYAVIEVPEPWTQQSTWRVHRNARLSGPDFHAQPGVPHDLLGLRLRQHADVRVAAVLLTANGELGCPVLILTKGQEARVDLVCQAPFPALLEQQSSGRLPAIIRSLGKMTGAGSHRFLVVRHDDLEAHRAALADMVRQGWLTDVVPDWGSTLRQSTVVTHNDLMDPRQAGRRVA